jgi:hypothetical protein
MKRKLLIGVVYVFIAWSISACEALSNCEACKTVTTDITTGYVTESLTETQYCGAELLSIKTKSNTNGSLKTTYKCR